MTYSFHHTSYAVQTRSSSVLTISSAAGASVGRSTVHTESNNSNAPVSLLFYLLVAQLIYIDSRKSARAADIDTAAEERKKKESFNAVTNKSINLFYSLIQGIVLFTTVCQSQTSAVKKTAAFYGFACSERILALAYQSNQVES